MRANGEGLIGICLLLLFCQLPKIDAKKKRHTAAAWSEWSEGECSRTCGGGVRKATRTCMNNRSDGRFHCEGPGIQYTSCNTQECPDRKDFRALQCAMFNKEPFQGRYHKWKPYYGDDTDMCALMCAANRTFHAKLADKVVDGTRCRPDRYDICVNGKCKSAGCDRQLNSTLKEDACRVCGGKGKDCRTVKGDYEIPKYKGYKDIITILKGATNIHIQEKKNTKNYFAVRNVRGKFYLNNQWNMTDHKKFMAARTMFRYQKDSNGQLLIARGPTTHALTLVLVGNEEPAKIHYEYYIPEIGHMTRQRMRRPKVKYMAHDTELPHHSREQPQDKPSLSKTRADGPSKHERTQTRRRNARDHLSPSADTPLPSGDAPPGWDPNRAGANYQWQQGSWTKCSATCGEGTQRRAVQCYDMDKRVHSEGQCPEKDKPRSTQKCETPCDVSFKWVEAGWTECSQNCGGGEMSSISTCEEVSKSGSKNVQEKHCEETLGPSRRQMKVCNEQQCPDSPSPRESPCWETLYGCCPDRRTVASGPDHAGCGESRAGCDDTEYGCCPDGVTSARGPRYAGCPSVPTNRVPASVPTSASTAEGKHICHTKQDKGTCAEYTIKWSYNATSGRCVQFWYGGCDGNDNRFEDERACLGACRGEQPQHKYPTRTATLPKDVPSTVPSESHPRSHSTDGNVCEGKAEVGTCSTYVTKWFYNSTSERCEQFWYGGCGGNDNRFDSNRDCQEKCRQGTASSCSSTPFGCCEDRVTAARGPQRLGCPESDCKSSRYGCCPDGVTASRGQEYEGCATRDCKISEYGCCQDGVSFAKGENYRGCRQQRCDESPHGCCPDGVSFAQGDNYAGCRGTNECERTEYGCCPDQRTTAQGPNGEGCCHYTEFGCCPDGLTISGLNHERCRTQDCRRSKYGCCRDGVNFARGENFKGCPSTDFRTSATGCFSDGVTFVSEGCAPPDCHATSYGCCPDGQTIARGYFHEGCREKDCRQSRYGCCPDGVSYAKGEDYEGCPTCRETKYGCCPDSTTVARGDNYLGCTLGSCHSSDYGCCPDMRTSATGPEHLGCKEKDCRQYIYGCCEDGVTYARGRNMDGCPKKVEGCASSRYGCCEDERTAARGPDRYGCPETRCINSEFGCCEDGVTFARGGNFEGCPRRRVGGCVSTRHGCCEDGRTAAQGPDRYGCPETLCINSEFGCCEDGVTFARGANFEGCPRRRVGGCVSTRHGCCEDGRTAAQGPDRYGCPETHCTHSEFGCCEDGVTVARGANFEGCPRRRVGGCRGTRHGCCEDGRTAAQGPDRYGCPETHCTHSEFGCCEDGVTFARGGNFEGCPRRVGGCVSTRHGCCEDGRTAAQGPDRYGCPETHCKHSEFGCCEDGVTVARGGNFEGCPRRVGGCVSTRHGCCEDGRTAAQGPDRYGCPETHCTHSEFGCCEDGVTFARGANFEGCPRRLGGCVSTRHGCCEDGRTAAQGPDRYGCPETHCTHSEFGCCEDGVTFARGGNFEGCPRRVGGCVSTRHGCCEDGRTAAQGPDRYGCPETHCKHSEFGCCEDGVTVARGGNFEGCPRRVGGCVSTRHGCCEDGRTAAQGPDRYGCPETHCTHSEFGCCEDGVTFARGGNFEGCPRRVGGCVSTRHGCCEDGRTAAQGPDRYGCPETHCKYSEFGCCEDGVTVARGANFEGCPRRLGGCVSTRHGCCEDGRTAAQGPDRYGCPETHCTHSEFGCCEDGVTFARGGNFEGCPRRVGGCVSTRHGCCEDGRTAAQGPDRYGCPETHCKHSEFGCCEDGVTVARGANFEGCPRRLGGCVSTRHGCCEDGRTAAQGPDRYGCPETHCTHSEFGCCEDGVTVARGANFEGCPRRLGGCVSTRHGCCEDGRTAAQGPDRYGCPETHCTHSEFGCCEDGVTVARGANFEGCPRRLGGCVSTRHGCCEDGRTAAQGPDRYGCPETHCTHSEFGCCEDGVTVARGANFEGCPRRLGGCVSTRHGCCEDGRTGAQGPDRYGCPETHCKHSEFGCCEDGVTVARGANFEGCPRRRVGGCRGTRHGCCEDGRTAAQGPDRYGCPETHCKHSEFGCCEDGVTIARGANFEGCPRRVDGCVSSRYGCCEDGRTGAQGPDRYGCPETHCKHSEFGCCEDGVTFARGANFEGCPRRVDGCVSSRYGCCEDGRTGAQGPDRYGCPETHCKHSEFGCCEDGVTFARGANFEGCPRRVDGCVSSRYGCCEDGRTGAQGPDRYGCPETHCKHSEFGCCEDGVTFARGANFEGCPRRRVGGCVSTRHGCCEDGRTAAQGPNRYGCPETHCTHSEFGCCEDGVTFARGVNFEGCPRRPIGGCRGTRHGCCEDGRTAAQGPDRYGCPETHCKHSEFGCCEDGVTIARGGNFEGCPRRPIGGCRGTRHGCCEDGRTAAQGPDRYGCPETHCKHSEFGCCEDGVTIARGGNFEGCPRRPIGGCRGTRHGCCEDGRTAAQGPGRYGCPETHCKHSEFGCCEDGVTIARGANFEGCPRRPIGGCRGTRHGCCEDGRTAAQGPDRYGCPETQCTHSEFGCCEDGVTFARGGNFEGCPRRRVGGCRGTRHGCCEDGRTAAQGPDRYGCPETHCKHSEFGCCEDGVTIARGGNFEGCPRRRVGGCRGTRHGCCEDGRTAAQGPDRYGCPETHCTHSEFGCCEDGVTFARGGNFEGCPRRRVGGCESTRHGCCEDGRTAAQGPDRHGCPETRCDLSEYGCCPDGRTFARGPNHEGCRRRDCSHSKYGCCPDGVSFARGQNYTGCEIDLGCEASAYGCCPDMVTAASSPGYAGCPPGGCSSTRYGCCPDKITYADGPNYAGCDLRTGCESARYGCCPDRKSAARGPDYAGCAVPTASGQVDCESDKDTGSCSDYVTKWFFNVTSSRCEQFWYGGCDGNNNRYDTERECDRKCRRRRASPTTAAPLDPCHLPHDEGTCSSSNTVRRWYYEESSRSCQVFWYSGCDGNGNNFESESACVQRCFLHDLPVTSTEPPLSRDPPVCNFKEAYGTCQSNIQRYRYDAERGDCVAFNYSGCNGNANNFVTLDACRTKCGVLAQPSVATTTARQVETKKPTGLAACSLEKDESVCPDGIHRTQIAWYYDLTLAACQQFNYSGCGGNNNRFNSAEVCTRTCNSRDICQMPDDSGICLAYSEFWYFNTDSRKCETFIYGGCGGNANRFATKSTCKKTCRALMTDAIAQPTAGAESPTREKTKDACLLPQKPGTCHVPLGENVWFYNMTEGICQLFDAGGCSYNDNKFSSREECERTCDIRELCTLPKDLGTCYAYSQQYYFNPRTKRCEHFDYGGCGGNANRFPSVAYCEKACNALMDRNISTGPARLPDELKIAIMMCHLPVEKGPCRSNERKWYYEVKEARCRQFTYGGCQGNQNRFETREECENTCSPQVVCSFSRDTGNCTAYHRGYYFNSAVGRCEHLTYGDCYGNANRFYTIELCEGTCRASIGLPEATSPRPEPTVTPTVEDCHLPKEIGPCRAAMPAWHYDSLDNTCKQFYYGGCQGNANRFQTKEECEKTCNTYDICNLPQKSELCSAHAEQFYFNRQSRRCEQFVSGGCGGNANRFASLEKCHLVCRDLIEKPVTLNPTHVSITPAKPVEVCHLEKKIGSCLEQLSTWYYDTEENTCKHFYYGGCNGNGNRFQTREECESICNPNDICNLPKEFGICFAYSEQYYFNPMTRRCEEFVYGGCGGNANRFVSLARCLALCHTLIEQTTIQPKREDPNIFKSPVEACHLEKKVGSCEAQLPAWYYDAVDHQCKQFYYGGCEGNANKFESKEECQHKCNAKSICQLPKESGQCYSYSEQYYFNSSTKRCEQFTYGGCDGNANRFVTAAKCMDICRSLIERESIPTPTVTDKPLPHPAEACHLEKESGPCTARFPAWHYDAVDHQCKEFYYGGCKGNANKFNSAQECHQTCNPQSICKLPKEARLCYAYSEQYYFNSRTKRCEQFGYGGCGGNANRFSSVAKCTDVCKSLMHMEIPETTPQTHVNPVEVCHLEKEVGPCRAQLPAWYYDAVDHQCKQFYYGGCEGNANKFESKEECQHKCNAKSICQLPKESGQCYSYSEQYYFNSSTKRCEQFTYGGCDGNANRFVTAAKCMDICISLIEREIIPTPTVTDKPLSHPAEACHLEKESGPCTARFPAWHYDAVDHQCKQFYYGGCKGNANKFNSAQECHQTCNPQSICKLPKDAGLCYAYSEQYYFNSRTKRCVQFGYGGCGGNANRFSSVAKCTDVCKSLMHMEIPETTPQTHVNPELCQFPRDSGTCFNYSVIYYFDQLTNRCKEFVYSGCDGNANRFQSLSECRRVCRPVERTTKPVTKIDVPGTPKRDKEVCRLRKLIGPCHYNITAWYFDEKYGVCSMFIYSGCGGNKNNFRTFEECENVCQPTNDVCNHPMAVKQCPSSKAFWVYDRANQTCRYFPTGNCEDSPLQFSSESACQKQCVHQDTEGKDVCHFQMEEGPCRDYLRVWYYNMDEAICKPFIYGGCDGNKNRFDTKQKCERVCNKHAICKLRKDPGICYGYNDAYYFNPEKNTCEHFVYGGCGGNANRFSSMNKCYEICGGHISNRTHEKERKEAGKCQLEPESGPCQERNIFWYYDSKIGVCSRFYYTGCGGNDNRFATEEDCLASCKSVSPITTYAPVTQNSLAGNPKNRLTTIHVAPKQTLTLHCGELIDSTGEGNPVTWTHEGQDIVPSARRQTKNLNLVVYDASIKDAGLYSCREKSNTVTPTLDKYKVVIKVPVTIEYGASHMSALPNHQLAIPCQAHGVPKPLITWYKGGQQIHNDNHYRIFDNGTLLIDPFTTNDVATYKCLARNGYEGKAEKEVKVTIQDSLNLEIKKSNQNLHVGDKITLTCIADGYPNTRLQWFYKDRELSSDDYITVRDGVLVIRNATYDNSGIYTCRGTHGGNQVNKDESLRILSMPDEVPKVCEDKLPINRCRMIVAAKLCKRKTFHKNCCVSCSRSMAFRR